MPDKSFAKQAHEELVGNLKTDALTQPAYSDAVGFIDEVYWHCKPLAAPA